MSTVKWAWDHEIRDLGSYPTTPPYTGHNAPVQVVPLADLAEVVEGLRFIAVSKDEDVVVIAQRLLAQLAPEGE